MLLLLEKKDPLAVILIDRKEDTYQTKAIRDPEFMVPVCTVSKNSGRKLLDESGEITVSIKSRRFSTKSWNIFGLSAETQKEKIRVIAHYDTASDCRGAKDNGSGTAVMMEVADALYNSGLEIPVEFIAFGAEEYAGLGSLRYLQDFPEEIDNTKFVICIDSVGSCGTESQVFVTQGYKKLKSSLKKQIENLGGYHSLIDEKMPMYSDHGKFCRRNIPAVFMHDTQPFFHHTPMDIPRFISLQRLEDTARIIFGLLADWA